MIVHSQSGFKFLIPVPDNCSVDKYTTTFDTHVVPTMGYPYCIVFDLDNLFISLHFEIWSTSNRIKLKSATICYSQTDGQSEIVNKEIIQAVKGCKLE